MGQYILSHDIGTSGDKAALFTVDGEFVKDVVAPYETFHPHANWSEQDPEDWWKAVCSATKTLLDEIDKDEVVGIACTGTMMGCLFLDKDGNPLMRSIIWSDGRSDAECNELDKRIGSKKVKNISGIPLSPNYAISKMMWVKKECPDVYQKAEHCIQSKDYVTWKMTGCYVTDPTDADFCQCYDMNTGSWSDEILEAAEIKKNILPEVIESSTVVGKLKKKPAEELGLTEGIPVVTGAGDGPASSLGLGLFEEGAEMISLGSSGGVTLITKKPEQEVAYGLPVGAHVIEGLYALGGAMQTAGASLQWAKERIAPDIDDYDEIYRLAATSPIGSNGVFFLPYLEGERTPFWNVHLRGGFLNLSDENSRADMLRAVMEGVALHNAYIHELLKPYGDAKYVLINGRGAQSDLWCGMISDALNMEVRRYPDAGIATSLGAAMLASVGLGFVGKYTDFTDKLGHCDTIYPNQENHKIYEGKLDQFIELYQAIEPVYDLINE